MSQELERVYTINLGKVKLSQSQHRAVRAINMIREFARHHMKIEEIKIEEELAHLIWSKGVRNPPRKVRVRMTKTDDGYILVSQYTEEVESEVDSKKDTKKIDDKVETPSKETPSKETPSKETPSKETPSKETPSKETPKKETPKKETPKKETPKKETPKKETPKKVTTAKKEPNKK
jgi:large subunit ribosomal protein L31e